MRDRAGSLNVADALESTGASNQARSTSRSSTGSNTRAKYTNVDLPYSLGTGTDKSWRNTFCHTFFEYMGTADDPWTIEESYVWDVWSVVYPELLLDEKNVGAVCAIVSRLSVHNSKLMVLD